MGKFWEAIATQLGSDWASRVLLPSFMFGALGLLAFALGPWLSIDQFTSTVCKVQGLNTVLLGALLVVGLIGLFLCGLITDQLTAPFLRLLQGYWPDWPVLNELWLALIGWQEKKRVNMNRDWQKLAKQQLAGTLDRAGARTYARLDDRMHRLPAKPLDVMPTRLGNILKAGETRPENKYGLDAYVCWARMWLLLDKDLKEELTAARAALDNAVRALMWGLLALIWITFAWWVVLPAGVAIFVAWQAILAAAETYADMLEGSFDTHRRLLYDALAWPKPASPAEEQALGEQITKYLYRGDDAPLPRFTDGKPPAVGGDTGWV